MSLVRAKTAPPQRLRAVAMLSFGVAVSSTQDAYIKFIAGSYPFHQMQFIRSAVALPLILLIVWRAGDLPAAFAKPTGTLLLRSFMLSIASISFYLGLAALDLPDAVAIYFSLPLMIAALSSRVIGESVPPHRFLAMIVAFVGVVVIVRPGTGVFNPGSLIVLFATACYALGHMLTRPLGATMPTTAIALWQNFGFLVTASLLGLVFGTGAFHSDLIPSVDYLTRGWVTPTAGDLLLMMSFGVSTALAMIFLTAGYRLAEPSFVAPFEYSALFWAVMWGFLLWGTLPGAATVTGSALVIGAGLYMLSRETRGRSPRPSDPTG
ncbi:MAG: DMT family transporter [Hyphomicrobiales bacterium]